MNDNKSAGLTARQASAIAFVALLPPATRLLPGLCAELSGRAAWLCSLVALPFLAITAWLVGKLTTNAASDENLAGLILRGLGPYAGAAVLIIYALWMVFLCWILSSQLRFQVHIHDLSGRAALAFYRLWFCHGAHSRAFSPALACACL